MSPFIDGHEFPEKVDGMTLIDAYYVPDAMAPVYRAEREHVAKIVHARLSEFCTTVQREFSGSQDGEAITGCDASGCMIALVHLDPDSVEACLKAARQGCLLEEILATNEISFKHYRTLKRELGIAREQARRQARTI